MFSSEMGTRLQNKPYTVPTCIQCSCCPLFCTISNTGATKAGWCIFRHFNLQCIMNALSCSWVCKPDHDLSWYLVTILPATLCVTSRCTSIKLPGIVTRYVLTKRKHKLRSRHSDQLHSDSPLHREESKKEHMH